MPETATWESTYFLRELWLKRSWPQCKHMSEGWLTISHYNSLSTHPGSSNSCPHNSQKVSEIRSSEYSTQSPNKTHRPWASRSVAGEGGGLRFPARERGPESGEDTQSASLQLPEHNMTRGGFVWRNMEQSAPRQHWHITLIWDSSQHWLTNTWQTHVLHTHAELIRTRSKHYSRKRYDHFDMTFSAWHCT